MTLLLVAGARPQFVKAAALLPALRARSRTLLVHTGQHDDPRMVEDHFEGLGLAAPDVRLPTTGRHRARRLAEMVAGLSDVIERHRPRRVLAVGDADSAVAAALAASLAGVDLAHVEAGARSGERDLPEERNRLVVDELADLLLCSTPAHADNLQGREGVHLVGDVMADLLRAREPEIRARAPRGEAPYGVLTLHRAANADDPAVLARVFEAVGASGRRVLFPVHPRLRLESAPECVTLRPPLPYLDFLGLVAGAAFVLTDSGGLQKEAYLLGVPCVTLREATEWGETVEAGWNALVGTDPARMRAALRSPPRGRTRPELYGDGRAAQRVAELV